MNTLKHLLFLFSASIVVMGFSQCASSLQLQESTTIKFGKPYYQSWAAGIESGGSGTNLFIPVNSKPENIVLDSVYFKGRSVALEKKTPTLYVGRFKNVANSRKDIIMSNEPYAEYGNKAPKLPEKIPFELADNECVVVYTENTKTRYFKITDITKQESQFYPQAPKQD